MYRHFDSKAKLEAEVFRRQAERELATVRRAASQPTGRTRSVRLVIRLAADAKNRPWLTGALSGVGLILTLIITTCSAGRLTVG
jgi:AcrR family transcriptional regulator